MIDFIKKLNSETIIRISEEKGVDPYSKECFNILYTIGYLISYIDCEGCLDLYEVPRDNKKQGIKYYTYSRTILSNKNEESLIYLREFLDMGIVRYNKSNDIYTLTLNDTETKKLIERYGDLLIVKEEEVKILRDFYKDKESGFECLRDLRRLKRGWKYDKLPKKAFAG